MTEWLLIETAPDDGEQILVGFMGQFKWISYVAPAYGKNTGRYMPFAPPSHWKPITPPNVG
jgi:hypothetical protein